MCAACLRPCATCICKFATPVVPTVDVLVLQHPLEVANAKGTARLLHLCLQGSTIITGETFEAPVLHELLYSGNRRPVLLYPELADERSLGIAPPPVFDAAADPSIVRLVVLDGTWRKSRKMLYQNRALQALPRLPLTQVPASQYSIRKAHLPDQLSTLEAACYALMQLENNVQKFLPVLNGFDGFVAQYASTAGQGPRPGQ